MADTILQFLDLAGTIELKDKILSYVDDKDKDSIKGVDIKDGKLYCYRTLPIEGATAAYELELPETDLSDVMRLVAGAVENHIAIFDGSGQAKDSGKSLADFYVKTDIDGLLSALEQKVDTNAANIEALDGDVDERITAAKTELNTAIGNAKDELQGSIDGVDAKADTNAQKIGNLDELSTTQKDNLVNALEEVKASVAAGGEAGLVTIEESTDNSDYAKVYTLKQGGAKIGTIDIPKDMVVESGDVVVNPAGQPEGTYIRLVLANADSTELFINVGTLVDIYKAEGDATQVQIAIDSATREISATIVGGSIGSNEIADNAILTRHVADGNITKVKLSTAVQASLDKADASASQANLDAEIARATKAEEDLDARIDTLEENVSGNVATQIQAAKDEAIAHTDSEINKIKATIGTVPEGKNLVGMIEEATYDDTAIQTAVATNTKSITDLTSTHNTDKQALQAKDTEHDNAIAQHTADIEALEAAVGNIQAIPVTTITGLFS